MASRDDNVEPEVLWQWLSETEDALEKAVSKYNDLVEAKDKLDRREFVREILIRGLRQELRVRTENKIRAEDLAWALQIKLRNSEAEVSHVGNELIKLRAFIDTQARRLASSEILLRHERSLTSSLTERIRELIKELENLNPENIRKVQAAELTTMMDLLAEKDAVILSLKKSVEEMMILTEDYGHVKSKFGQLTITNSELEKLANDQASALDEWQGAYKDLEEEIRQLKIHQPQQTSAEAPVELSSKPLKVSDRLVSTRTQAVKIENTNGTTPSQLNASNTVTDIIAKEQREHQSFKENNVLNSVLGIFKILSKM